MHRIKISLLFLLIALSFFSGIPEQENGKKFVHDFDVLVTSLEELHPLLYKNISKEEFDKEVKAIAERLLYTSSKRKAIYMMQELVYKIGSAHAGNLSAYSLYQDSSITKILPFHVCIVNEELYIKNYPADTTYNGVKIISIGGTKSKALIDSLKIFIPLDGRRPVIDFALQMYFNAFYAGFCSQPDTFSVSTTKGMLKTAAAKRGTPQFDMLVSMLMDTYFGKERMLKKEMTSTYGYFRFDAFQPEVKNFRIEKDFNAMICELNKKKVPNLIIDLRYNNGGDPVMGARMLTLLADHPFRIFEHMYTVANHKPTYIDQMPGKMYFKYRNLRSRPCDSLRETVRFEKGIKLFTPQKERFKGRIYVLVGSTTKSAAPVFCKTLIGQSNVTFVGTETSGAINYLWAGGPTGTFCELRLLNLNTTFAFGIELLEVKDGSSKNELPVGLIPDQEIEYTIQEVIAGRDKEMEWVKKDIEGKK